MGTNAGLRRRKVTEEAEFVIKEDNALKEKFWEKFPVPNTEGDTFSKGTQKAHPPSSTTNDFTFWTKAAH